MRINELIKTETGPIEAAMSALSSRMRVALPGIIQSFDGVNTVTVLCAIRERINIGGNLSWETLPLLVDVPIIIPRAGGYCLTLPIVKGDECLVIFADMCIDAWYQSGDVQNQQDKRRHDLSDGFAIIGPWSKPKAITDYSSDTAQLRNEDGTAYIELDGTTINIQTPGDVNINSTGGDTTVNCDKVTVNASDEADITAPKVKVSASDSCEVDCPQIALSDVWANLRRLVDERAFTVFNAHVHSYGGNYTGAPTSGMSPTNHATAKVRGL